MRAFRRSSRVTMLVAGAFFTGLVVPIGVPLAYTPVVVATGLAGLGVCLLSTLVVRLREQAALQRAFWQAENRMAYRLHRHVPIQPPKRRRREAIRSIDTQYLPVTSGRSR